MELFKQASPCIQNTRQGNILLMEILMETEARNAQYGQFKRERTRKDNSQRAVEDAEYEWERLHSDPQGKNFLFNDDFHERSRRISGTHDKSLDLLMKNRTDTNHQKMFFEQYGWLPKGMPVPKGARFKGAR
jgi:hypothetical protein